MRVIAVANQKGGCGKTTTAINLSSCLALKGQKVLLIDFDPQSHATMGLNIECNPERNIYHVMAPARTGAVGLDDVIVSVKENFDIAPSDMLLCAVEQELAGEDGREKRLLEAIERLQKPYDFIIIDCPPSIGHLCFNALRASSEAIIPIDMSLFSLRGIAKLTDMMVMIEATSGHLIAPRALVTMFDARTRYSREVLKRVREKFEDKVSIRSSATMFGSEKPWITECLSAISIDTRSAKRTTRNCPKRCWPVCRKSRLLKSMSLPERPRSCGQPRNTSIPWSRFPNLMMNRTQRREVRRLSPIRPDRLIRL